MTFPAPVAEALARLEKTRRRYFNLHPDAAALLRMLAALVRARRVVEVGTSNGYSAIVLGATVREHGGCVITIERDGERVKKARVNIRSAGLEDVVTVVAGSAYKALKSLKGPVDFAFLDGTKQEYLGYLDRLRPLLADHAIVVADNLLSHADELAEFRASMESDPHFDTVVLSVGMGLLLARTTTSSSREPNHLSS